MVSRSSIILFSCLTIAISSTANDDIQSNNQLNKVQPLPIQQQPFSVGSLTVICGSMCSGKSEETIKQISRFILAGFEVLVFKPQLDNRKILDLEKDPLSYISSRNGSWINCTPVRSVEEMEEITRKSSANVIAIDEVHFFGAEQEELLEFVKSTINSKKKVIIAGLELDFRAEPFGPMPNLLAIADNVIKLKAICHVCGDDTFCLSQRLIDGEPAHYNDPIIVVGFSQYEPRCRKCFTIKKD